MLVQYKQSDSKKVICFKDVRLIKLDLLLDADYYKKVDGIEIYSEGKVFQLCMSFGDQFAANSATRTEGKV